MPDQPRYIVLSHVVLIDTRWVGEVAQSTLWLTDGSRLDVPYSPFQVRKAMDVGHRFLHLGEQHA